MTLALSFSPRVVMRVEVVDKRIGKFLKYFTVLIVFFLFGFCNWFCSIQVNKKIAQKKSLRLNMPNNSGKTEGKQSSGKIDQRL